MECIWDKKVLSLDGGVITELPVEVIEILKHGSNSEYLDALTSLALDPRWTVATFVSFEPLFVDVCSRWKSARLSQVAPLNIVAALARILPFAPHLSIYAEEIIYHSRDSDLDAFFSRGALNLSGLPDATLLNILLALTRLVEFDNECYAPAISPAQLQLLLYHSQECIRYLAIKLLCLFLHASELTFLEMVKRYIGLDEVLGGWEDKEIDYTFYTLWEEKRLSGLRAALFESRHSRMVDHEDAPFLRVIEPQDFLESTACLAGILLPRTKGAPRGSSTLIMTKSTQYNMRQIATAILGSQPVLITGLLGAGKTSIIREIARTLDKETSLLTLYLNEQTDAKLLIGMYTSAGSPGSFSWRPGVLTTAVREGRWVIIEDLDRAPTEVLSILLPLLERGELLVPNLGGAIHAARGFRLFATIRSTLNTRQEEMIPGVNMLGIRSWHQISLKTLSYQDLQEIVSTKYSLLHEYQPLIMSVYSRLRGLKSTSSSDNRSVQHHRNTGAPQVLLRSCQRLQSLLSNAGVHHGDDPISEFVNDNIFMEVVDCFAASTQSGHFRARIIEIIAQEMHVSPARAGFCTQARIPFYENTKTSLSIGRAVLQKRSEPRLFQIHQQRAKKRPFAMTRHALRICESISVSIKMREPCLLVGETGTGKTTIVQELAESTGHKLVVVNLSQQSEAGDLLGGYKPISLRALAIPMKEEFEDLLVETLKSHKNQSYLESLSRAIASGKWSRALKLWQEALRTVQATFEPQLFRSASHHGPQPRKRRKVDSPEFQKLKLRWDAFADQVQIFEKHLKSGTKGFAFAFAEGRIVKAVRNGEWVLLDEINLASPDTLESLSDLLYDGTDDGPSLLLSETGEVERVKAHPEFRIFGAMNPATDIGKRDLPIGLRSRFTEYYIETPDTDVDSLVQVVNLYLGGNGQNDIHAANDAVRLYLDIRSLEERNQLVDGAGQKPHFTLRTLTRTITYVTDIAPAYGLRRAMFEGFAMSFLTHLSRESEMLVLPLMEKHLIKTSRNLRALLNQVPRCPNDGKDYIKFKHYWIAHGSYPIQQQSNYIITPFIEKNLLNLVRATSTRRFPVLLQGPTSSGKTSLLEYLAKISGNNFVRINNHEHTDLQEYLGTYISGPEGQLQYQEGVLIRALREGHWIVLDELNLAPSDILEALNRLLDDNRELLLPETQEVVRPHENFMLFATQNPPGLYGGRKLLSRAFRNRFLELHFDDIPEDDLETILRERSQIAPSFCARIVTVYKKLAVLRQSGRLFERNQSFATLRDLFRWALRNADDREQLAKNGYMLLAERVRNVEERSAVKRIIEEVMKVQINESSIYSTAYLQDSSSPQYPVSPEIVWTKSMRRLYTLVVKALENNEPVLLVGETGCGKTSICQLIANVMNTQLHIVNAHQNTETGDFIGAQRPIRNRSAIEAKLLRDLSGLVRRHLSPEAGFEDDLPGLIEAYRSIPLGSLKHAPVELRQRIDQNIIKVKALFEWSDGSLVHAMKAGQHFLLDEISLADDSVLERLNSVLESSRTILLAEKGGEDTVVTASSGFQFLATMNPGGDYGKRELSPALRNRFTEIWVPAISDEEDILDIVRAKLLTPMVEFATPIVDFSIWHSKRYNESSSVSIREVLTWVDFVNTFKSSDPYISLLHGAAMVYIDALGANPAAKVSISSENSLRERHACLVKLNELLQFDMMDLYNEQVILAVDDTHLKIGPFEIAKPKRSETSTEFSLSAPTVILNALRVVRTLQLRKPVLIEGSPGVGKTTLVTALAHAIGMPLTRINLSEQTDIMDLFGSDVPIEGGKAGQFAWRDAPFLQAMQKGEWVLLDEMNLASQSVLEGLNACLDHRGQVYIPELDQSFLRHPSFVVFAAQNPHHQGGGRKGLPASFVNRFTVVYADLFTAEDFMVICRQLYPQFSIEVTHYLIHWVMSLSSLADQVKSHDLHGGPWEFNLRDVLRWHHLLNTQDLPVSTENPAAYQDLLFFQRFRSREDVMAVCTKLLPSGPFHHDMFHNISPSSYQVGLGLLVRNEKSSVVYPQRSSTKSTLKLPLLESVILCIQNRWPCLLVGSSGSGKSHIIRHLAARSGADLLELSLTTDMDTMDIVGGYEQTDKTRNVHEFVKRLRTFLCKTILRAIASSTNPKDAIVLLDQIDTLDSHDLRLINASLSKLENGSIDPEYEALIRDCRVLSEQATRDDGAHFEWIDGILVKALKQGKWLLLDNANLCGASVLDRLNSLLEPNGVLTVNEHRSINGSAEVIRPHGDFQLFLTMDPRYGELSRAMRNRCVELFVPLENDTTQLENPRSACESSIFRYQPFQVVKWNSLDDSRLRDLATICVDHLAFIDFRICQRWFKQAGNGLLDIRPSQLQVFSHIFEIYQRLLNQKSNVVSTIRQLYQGIAVEWPALKYFCEAQTFHPLNNSVILPKLVKAHPPSQPELLATLLETEIDLELLRHDFNDIRISSVLKLASRLSRLERSMASDHSLTFSKESTQPLAHFLEETNLLLLKWTDKLIPGSPSCQVASALIKKLTFYTRDMFDFAQLPTFDESRFQVYLTIGETIAANCQKFEELRELGRSLALNLGRFNASWSLSTGTSMEILWEMFKPRTAKNLLHLERLLQVEKLADRFDRLQWHAEASIETLIGLHESIGLVYRQVELVDDGGHISLKDLEKAVGDAEAGIGSQGTLEYPYFQDEFEGLCQYSSIDSKHNTKEISALSLLAGRASRESLRLDQDSNSCNLLAQIVQLTAAGYPKSSLIALRNVLPASICTKIMSITNVTLGSLNLLRQESRLLTRGVVNACESISKNQYHALNGHLLKLHIVSIKAHAAFFQAQSVDAYINFLEENLDTSSREVPKLLMLMKEEVPCSRSANHLRDIMSRYFEFSVQKIYEAQRDSEQISSSAAAWISFFIGCLLLYVPDRQNDPALRLFVERSRYDKRKEELQHKLEALKTYEGISTGQNASLRGDLIERDLQALGDRPHIANVARPEKSELEQLQGDFTNILNSIVGRSPDMMGLQNLLRGDLATKQEVKLVRQNITQVVSRLSSHYRAYDDITKPVIAFLRGLDLGLALGIMASATSQERTNDINFIYKTTPLMGLEPETLNQMTIEDVNAGSTLNFDHRLVYLRLATLARSIGSRFDDGTRNIILEIFHTFFDEWKGRLEADQTENTAKSSLYRYRGSEDADDEADEQELIELFPDYSADSRSNAKIEVTGKDDPRTRTLKLADCHLELFKGAQDASHQLCAMLEKGTNDVATIWNTTDESMSFPLPAEEMLPGTILILDSASKRLLHQSSLDHTYNFYVDANLVEAQRLVSLVKVIQMRIRAIKEAWPEHETLRDIIRLSDELLSFRHIEPVAKMLSKAEQLHSYIHEWQIIASREYSATNAYDGLTDLIVSWRRLELSTWARLLDLEDQKCQSDAKSWWFVAYEVIIAAPLSIGASGEDLSRHAEELLATLGDFFQTTLLGQYSQRLLLIEQFKDHLQLLVKEVPGMQSVHSALTNFLCFYSRFEPQVQETLQKGRQGLEKDMKEILLLASWKDTNINALRESAKRSHHKLFKVVRKYRSLLAQSSQNIINLGLPRTSGNQAPRTSLPQLEIMPVDPYALQICKESLPGWASKSARLTDPSTTAMKMHRMVKPSDTVIDCALYIDSYVTNLVETIKILQKETPSVMTETNKEAVKHLKSRKRKVFADTLKDMRSMGFKSNLGADVLRKQASLSVVLASTPILTNSYPIAQCKLDSAESYFHQTLDHIRKSRELTYQHSEDLTVGEISKSLGYLEGIISVILRQRISLSLSLAGLDELNISLAEMQVVWAPNMYSLQKAVKQDELITSSIKHRIKWLPSLLSVSCTVVRMHDNMGEANSSNVFDALCGWKDRFVALNKSLESLPTLPPGLTASSHSEIHRAAEKSLEDLSIDLERIQQQHPAIGFMSKKLKPWMVLEKPFVQREINGHHPIDLMLFDEKVSTAVDSILVGIQNMQEILQQLPCSDEGRAWLSQSEIMIAKSYKALHTHDISFLLNELMSQLQHLASTGQHEVKIAAALCATILPIVQQYRDISQEAAIRQIDVHRSLCKLAIVLTTSFNEIARNGFCSPSENSVVEEGKTEKVEGGTGLGDGEGATDISKDIQHDEDLSELAQEGADKQDQEDIEDQSDAIDMQHDELEGQVGDMREKGEDDEENPDNNDENDEMEEEIGSVGDLNPSAVDEKMWNDKDDKTSKEKEDNQSKGTREEDLAAQDDLKENPDRVEADEGSDDVGAEESEKVRQEDIGKTDPYLQEGENLNLPEEMDLDGDKQSISGSDTDGVDDLSDIQQSEVEDSDMNGLKDEDPSEVQDDQGEPGLPEPSGETDVDDDTGQPQDAECPVDTESEEEERVDDLGLLRDRTDNAVIDAANIAPSEMEDIGKDASEPNDTKKNQGSNAQNSKDLQPDSAESSKTATAADDVQTGQAADPTEGLHSGDEKLDDINESQAFKKLGDALEKWHRQRQQIHNSTSTPQANESSPLEIDAPDQEFEHVPNEDAVADTQALGAATEDQTHALDKRALDSEISDQPNDFWPDSPDQPAIDESDKLMQDAESVSATANDHEQLRPGALIGTGKQAHEAHRSSDADIENEKQIEDLDTDFSIVHLESADQNTLRSMDDARRLWSHYESLTRGLSLYLTEQLRLILAPTVTTKMRGDFRTGKRLNIKRVIPYIASQYKRDKIWMRRSVPSKRSYQVLLAIDDSKSMGESGSGQLAFETLALVSKSLSMLEVGQICIVSFGDEVRVAHEFEQTFSSDTGVNVFQQFAFQQTRTNVQKLIAESINLFRNAKSKFFTSAVDIWQLELIISDGICEDHECIRRLVRQAHEERIMIVFVIVDALKGESIMDMTQATFEPASSGETKLKIKRYLDNFPFSYYLIVGNINELPGVLATALRQWFAEVAESGQ